MAQTVTRHEGKLRPKKLTGKGRQLIINQVTTYQLKNQQVAVDKWRTALHSAESSTLPYRKRLYEIYREIMLDAHLYAIVQKRIRKIRNTSLRYIEDGRDTTDINKAHFEAPWFTKTIDYIMETVFWGHSLIEFFWGGGYMGGVELIPRHHVHPEFGTVTPNDPIPSAAKGIPFRERPYSDFSLEVDCGLGLLNIAAANAIFKRNGTVDYANFVEMFGSPIREFNYDGSVSGAKQEAEQIARDSGHAAAIVTPMDYVGLTLHKGADSANSDLHHTFLKDLRDELTVLVLGQTMTTGDGSSRSQAEVHERVEGEVTREDKKFVEYVLNWELKEKFIKMGLPLRQEGYFAFDKLETMTRQQQLEFDMQLATLIEIDDAYFYEKYNIPKPNSAK